MGDDIGLWIVQAGLLAHEWSCIAIVPRDESRDGKHFITKAEQKANADLFAAAPAMPEALKAAVSQVHLTDRSEPLSPDVQRVFDQCCAAIAKAEGKS